MKNTSITNLKSKNPINYILYINCVLLIIIGIWQIFTNRIEDGLINVIIGSSLITIPSTQNNFNYTNSPTWQKIGLVTLVAIVVIASIFVLYLSWNK